MNDTFNHRISPVIHDSSKPSYLCHTRQRTNSCLLIFILSQFLLAEHTNYVILANIVSHDFRCSHVPQLQEQATHIWLKDQIYSDFDKDSESTSVTRFMVEGNKGVRTIAINKSINNKTKRFASLRKDYLNPEASVLSSMWNNLRMSSESSSHAINDLVPIKIQVHYDNSVHSLQKQKLELIKDVVMPTVIRFFESVLSIRREQAIDKFRISRRCPNNTLYYAKDSVGTSRPYCMDRCEDYAVCGEMLVPSTHLSACSYCNSTSKRCLTNYTSEGTGVNNTQLLLYVSAKQTARCRKDQTIAYAAHCAQDAKTDRPVAGHANLCPSSISTDSKDLKALIATVKHELTHVLGFSVSLFAYYRDENGLPLTERDSNPGPIPIDPKTGYARWSEKIIKKVVRSDWVTGEGKIAKEVHLMVTPTVVREVRSHFNCSSLEGAELEDQGSDGTSMTHWEKRLFENEAMTGTHTQNSVYSRVTLAALQDTGWYVANFSRAEKLEWGHDLGCDFAKKSCKSWIDERRSVGKSIRPFCDRVKGDLLQIACTEDRSSKAVCNMKQYKDPLPLAYQNFEQLEGVHKENISFYGGSVDLADYCPFIQEFTWQAQNVTIRGSRCDIGGNNLELERNAALEYYGPQTRCFEHGRRWEQRSCIYKRHWHHYGAGCYKYSCSNGHVNVIVGSYTYPCYYQDQLVHIEQLVDQWLYNGTLICPSCKKVCPHSKCKTYDKKLIDRILAHDSFKSDNDIEETLKDLVLDSSNFIESSKDLFNIQRISLKQEKFDTDTNKSLDNIKQRDQPHQKENLLQWFSTHKNIPRHKLVCSSASQSVCNFCNLLYVALAMLTSSIIVRQQTNFYVIRLGYFHCS